MTGGIGAVPGAIIGASLGAKVAVTVTVGIVGVSSFAFFNKSKEKERAAQKEIIEPIKRMMDLSQCLSK